MEKLTLYSKNNCIHCEVMKDKLDLWGYEYEVVNIQEDPMQKEYILYLGHKTVPQLYYKDIHLNPNINTEDYTKDILELMLK